MASREAKTLITEAKQKVELGKKRKHSPDLDLFSYGNQIDLTFSYSTKSARIPITVDSSDDEDDNDDDDGEDDGVHEFKRTVDDEDDDGVHVLDDSLNDDSQEIQNIDSDDDSSVNKSLNSNHNRSPSPPPPPPSQAELLRVQRQLLKKQNTTWEFEHAFCSLKQAVAADSSSPVTPLVNRSTGVILLDDDIDTPLLSRNSADRKVVVKVRTSSGIKKYDMKAGEKFGFVINELAKAQNVAEENILLSFNNSNITPNDTPLSKGVTVADIVECVIMDSCPVVDEEGCIEIKVQGNSTASRKTFEVSQNQPLEKLFKEYSKFRQLPRSKLKFLFDGDALRGSETPADLDMEDGNVIDVSEIS